MRAVVAIWLGILLIAATACSEAATPTKTTSASIRLATKTEDIAGTWFGIGPDGMYFRFSEDGTARVARSLNNLDKNPNAEATFKFEANNFVITELSSSGLESCGPAPGTYQVQMLASGNIKFIRQSDPCLQRARSMMQEHRPVP